MLCVLILGLAVAINIDAGIDLVKASIILTVMFFAGIITVLKRPKIIL